MSRAANAKPLPLPGDGAVINKLPCQSDRQSAFEYVQQETADAIGFAQHATDIGRPDIATAVLADIHTLGKTNEQAKGDRTCDVTNE